MLTKVCMGVQPFCNKFQVFEVWDFEGWGSFVGVWLGFGSWSLGFGLKSIANSTV